MSYSIEVCKNPSLKSPGQTARVVKTKSQGNKAVSKVKYRKNRELPYSIHRLSEFEARVMLSLLETANEYHIYRDMFEPDVAFTVSDVNAVLNHLHGMLNKLLPR